MSKDTKLPPGTTQAEIDKAERKLLNETLKQDPEYRYLRRNMVLFSCASGVACFASTLLWMTGKVTMQSMFISLAAWVGVMIYFIPKLSRISQHTKDDLELRKQRAAGRAMANKKSKGKKK